MLDKPNQPCYLHKTQHNTWLMCSIMLIGLSAGVGSASHGESASPSNEPAQSKSESQPSTAAADNSPKASSQPSSQTAEPPAHADDSRREKASQEVSSVGSVPAARPSGRTQVVEIRLTGSMCLACLNDLQKNLKGFPGIVKVKIDYPGERMYDLLQSPQTSSWAKATIHYDPGLTSTDALKASIKSQGYRPFKVIERAK